MAFCSQLPHCYVYNTVSGCARVWRLYSPLHVISTMIDCALSAVLFQAGLTRPISLLRSSQRSGQLHHLVSAMMRHHLIKHCLHLTIGFNIILVMHGIASSRDNGLYKYGLYLYAAFSHERPRNPTALVLEM